MRKAIGSFVNVADVKECLRRNSGLSGLSNFYGRLAPKFGH
jgi:hypothetical protein